MSNSSCNISPIVGTLAAGAGFAYMVNNRQGVKPPKTFSLIVPNTEDVKSGKGAIHRNPSCEKELVSRPQSGEKTLYETFQRGVRISGDRPCLGKRPIVDGKAQPFVFETYNQVNQRVKAFGSGLVHLDLIPAIQGTAETGKMRMMAFFLKNSPEWVIAEQALFRHGGTTVPLYDTLGPDTVSMIVNETELTTILCTRSELARAVASKNECKSLRNIIMVDELTKEDRDAAGAAGVAIFSFSEVEKAGAANVLEPTPPQPETIATFCYTSGTTGKSKGALLSHGGLVANLSAVEEIGVKFFPEDRHISYLPLAHAFERIVQALVYYSGASAGFFQGDTLKIAEDIIALRPTLFPSVPRLLNKMYDKITALASSAGGVKAKLFEAAYSSKVASLKTGWVTHGVWDKLVFKKIAAKVGLDECRMIITGSAPIAPHVLDFLRVVFCCSVVEGYGQTECTAGATIGHPHDYTTGHVGGPITCNEIRLESVPEMEYLVEDQVHRGQPCQGRGEICIRGPNCFKGYYKMEEKTAEALDAEGWVHTGDIGMWTPKGCLKIVDRKKNIFKLAQGEYVAPEKIEGVYGKSALVAQSFVYGDSFQSVLVAIVVPDELELKKKAAEMGVSGDMAALCKNKDISKAVAEDMERVGKEAKLFGFERAKAITLHPNQFTPEDILTPTFKLKRNDAQKLFQSSIDEMYAQVGHIAGKQSVKQGHH